ncbi:MAG: DUF4965 domain-containing protein [Pirellulaceae bacterium]
MRIRQERDERHFVIHSSWGHGAVFGLLALAACLSFICPARGDSLPPLRYPAVPLVTCDPYFSIWSAADRLNDKETVHWTGFQHRLLCLMKIGGKFVRLCGQSPAGVPAMPQLDVQVRPTQTIYRFADGGIEVAMTFTTAALPDDLELYARPVTYVDWSIKSMDGSNHDVELYFGAHPEIATHVSSQEIEVKAVESPALKILRVGTTKQEVLKRSGDNVRIDWGYLYLALPADPSAKTGLMKTESLSNDWVDGFSNEPDYIGRVSSAPLLSVVFEEMVVGPDSEVKTPWLILAYDDESSIQYFGKNLRPFWRRTMTSANELLNAAAKEHDALIQRCQAFDDELIADAVKFGGEKYARICSLAYRQCYAAHKLCADENGQPLLFSKENSSNGCIATVDVIYPASPFFLLFGSSLTKAMLLPNLDYASSPRWKFPFAPHDIGTYPLANGQVYGGGEQTEINQMPVEETGNMLLLVAALAKMEGNADFAKPYRPLLAKWGEFLREKGFNPENQLCTDDFAGHLAHNVNLSAKAICALGAYARICEALNEPELAKEYRSVAKDYAAKWVQEAKEGDHYRLAFDKPGTWSQKYNLVWDRLLGMNLFPNDVLTTEMTQYLRVKNRYGVPLDSRKEYAKLDWSIWTATLTGDRTDFDAVVDPIYDMLGDTKQRVPMTDLYATDTAGRLIFRARPVVGGVFLPFLHDGAIWKKWASRDRTNATGWAPFPIPK